MTAERTILILLLVNCLFILWTGSPDMRPFPLAQEIQVNLEQYVWLITQRLTIIVLAYHWWISSRQYVVYAFFVIQTLDLVDHLVHYNKPYLGEWFSFNTVSFLLFGVYLLYQRWNSR